LADREQTAGFFFVDVTIDGTPEQVKVRESEIRKKPPKKGSVNVHNTAETWSLNAPDLKQAASIETANALLTFILGGLGLPRHWYGYGDETNRATAAAQGDPTWRSLQHDQGIIHDFLLSMLEFQRDQTIEAGYWTPITDEAQIITLTMPEMTGKDIATLTAMLTNLASALMIAEQQGLMTHEQAIDAWAKAMAEIDVDIDTQAVLAMVAAQPAQPDMIGAMDAFNKYVEGFVAPDIQRGITAPENQVVWRQDGKPQVGFYSSKPFVEAFDEDEHPRDDDKTMANGQRRYGGQVKILSYADELLEKVQEHKSEAYDEDEHPRDDDNGIQFESVKQETDANA
ncbi:MAG: hypothetical protein ABIH03_00785, partial [Pseudomonadota bacterium]